MTFNAWDIILVPFPYSDREQVKQRPALVLSTPEYHAATSNVIAAMITTATATTWPNDIPIANLDSTNLNVPSVIRPKLFTIDIPLVKKRIGELHPTDRTTVRTSLKGLLMPGTTD